MSNAGRRPTPQGVVKARASRMYGQKGAGLCAGSTVGRFDDLIALRGRGGNGHIELEQARLDESGVLNDGVAACNSDRGQGRQCSALHHRSGCHRNRGEAEAVRIDGDDLSGRGGGKGIARHGKTGGAHESSIDVGGYDVEAIARDKERWRQRVGQRGE
jgi:hypothetical protein